MNGGKPLGLQKFVFLDSPRKRLSFLLVIAGAILLAFEWTLFSLDHGAVYKFLWAVTRSPSSWFTSYKLLFVFSMLLIVAGVLGVVSTRFVVLMQTALDRTVNWVKTGDWLDESERREVEHPETYSEPGPAQPPVSWAEMGGAPKDLVDPPTKAQQIAWLQESRYWAKTKAQSETESAEKQETKARG